MKVNERSSLHSQASQALLVISKHGSVVQQLQRVGMQEREKNRAAMKSLVRFTHFLTQHHIAHSSNYTQLVDLVCLVGLENCKVCWKCLKECSVHFSRDSGWLYRSTLNMGSRSLFLKAFKTSVFSVMADEWTDIKSVEELSFSVIGRKMALLSNAFGTCAFKESWCWEYILALVKYYTLPEVAKLCKSLQTKQLDLFMSSSLINEILHALMTPLLQQHIGFWNFWILRMTFSKRQEKMLVQTRSTRSRRQWGYHL